MGPIENKELKALTVPDTNNTDPAYWEHILEENDLSMKRGLDPRVKYVGGNNELAATEIGRFSRSLGYRPKGPKTE